MAKPEAPVLETERLRLRRRQHRDIPRMMQAYQDDEIRRYLGGHPPKDGAMLAQLVRRRSPTEWAVTLRGEDLYIGECTINRVVDGYLGELGYLFLREYWGKGYAAEAAQAVLDYAAGKLRLGRMCACIDAANTRSVRLAERLGFERIAFARSRLRRAGGGYVLLRPQAAGAGVAVGAVIPRPRGRGRHQCLRIVHGFLRRDVEKPFRGMVY